MGLFAKLFGKNNNEDQQKRVMLDALRTATAEPMNCGKCLERALKVFPEGASHDLKLEAVNALFEMERDTWAEALAVHLAHQEDVPLGTVKGLARHFIEKGEVGRVLEPAGRFFRQRPSETELAVEYGRALQRMKEYERIVNDLQPSIKNAAESRHLYAIVGEGLWRTGREDDALIHLRTACELYEQAFRLRQILPDDMNQEQLDYAHLHALLEECAKAQLSAEEAQEVMHSISLEPGSFGLVHEADRLAAERIDYKPKTTVIESIAEIDARIASLGSDLAEGSLASMLRAKKALREGRHEEALALFRQTLEIDLENYAAYYGWAACDMMMRREASAETPPVMAADQRKALEAIFADWEKLTEAERILASQAAAPVAPWLPRIAETGAEVRVHPLDVRLKDIYPERVEMRFEAEGRSPQAVPMFATRRKTHLRLDHFLVQRNEEFPAARALGLMLADTLTAEGGEALERAKSLAGEVRTHLPTRDKVVHGAVEDLLADSLEVLAAAEALGTEPRGELAEVCEKCGVFEFLRTTK